MKKLKRLPHTIYVAVSGGVDSVATLHFLKRKHSVTVLHYVHDSDYAAEEHEFVRKLCELWQLPLIVGYQAKSPVVGSREQYWRNGRYEFFKQFDAPVIIGTTLDDAVEWYIFTCLRGQGHYMNYQNDNVCKPFLTTRKQDLIDYALANNLEWIEDPSNTDIDFARRNRIRANLIPEICDIEPGIYGIVKKRIIEKTHSAATVQE